MRAGTVDIRQGDVLDRLREMPDGSVQCVVTSPPYWSLRDYGTGTWEGGAPECEHVMAPGAATGNRGNITTVPYRGTCGLCGAVRVDRQLGLEPTIEEYIERMVEVFREVWRVLRSDGTLWLNMGDCYCSGTWADRQPTSTEGDHVPASWAGRCQPGRIGRRDIGNEINGKPTRTRQVGGGVVPHPGPLPGGEGEVQGEGARLKSKDLVGQGWRLAFALQEDGWWLRSDIIWHKPNPMPECLDPSTQVFIRRNGWVSRVTLGQAAALAELPEILSPTGWVRIRRLWHVEKEAMTLGAGKVERVICSPDHRFPVSSDRRRVRTRLEPASAIRHEGYADYLLYCPIRPFLVPTITEWGGRPLDYDIGFLVGAYVAEGGHDGENGRRIKLTLGLHEEEFKAHLHERLAPWGLTWSESIHGNSVSLRVSDDGLERFFDAFVSGQVKTKSLNMELLLNCPEDFRRGVLDGYVQGDGTPGRGGGWRAVSASERLRDDLSTLASSLGIITSKGARVTTDERTGNTYYAWSLSTPYMTRRRVKSGTDGVMQVPPRCRRMILGTRQMIDLEVEGGVFLIGDGLLTHNSVHDRPTRSHEYLFLLTKSARYYYDADAVREPLSRENEAGCNGETTDWDAVQGGRTKRSHRRVPPSRPVGYIGPAMGRNLRDVWTVRSEPFPEAHFATFPVALVEPCIAAGVSERGACPDCGAPWARVVEIGEIDPVQARRCGASPAGKYNGTATKPFARAGAQDASEAKRRILESSALREKFTIGWQPTCRCYGTEPLPKRPRRPRRPPTMKVPTGWDTEPGAHGTVHREWQARAATQREGAASGAPTEAEERAYEAAVVEWRVADGAVLAIWRERLAEWKVLETVPCVVMDPFAGTFTVGLVGLRHGCDVIGIELNEEYIAMARRRVTPGLMAEMACGREAGAASSAPTGNGGDDGEESCDN